MAGNPKKERTEQFDITWFFNELDPLKEIEVDIRIANEEPESTTWHGVQARESRLKLNRGMF